jgi:hypothetical protein
MNSADVTILMSTSPVPAHPDTKFTDAAVEHARYWFPESKLIIMADGVWSGVEHRREQYYAYLDRIKNRYQNMDLEVFADHRGQAAMTQIVLQKVQTPYILFNEHDTIIDIDKPIDWDAIFTLLAEHRANVVRLSGFGEGVHPEHIHLTNGSEHWGNATFWRTYQWSQWPHVATTKWYRYILGAYFDINAPQMIEEIMQSVLQTKLTWHQAMTWIYAPDGNGCRVHHLDARFDNEHHRDPCFWHNV